MNFLAHIYLSGDNEKLMVGNFIGDHVKGRQIDRYDAEIKAGIYLHRAIDHFTDNHPVWLRSRERLNGRFGRYSGVITDMFYDHFLSANWPDYHSVPLEQFTAGTYRILFRYYLKLPRRTQQMLPFMARSNWLLSYGKLEGIDRALSGLARRTPFESGMQHATEELRKNYPDYLNEFRTFFPDLQNFTANWIEKNISHPEAGR
ncbi:MAG: acyl carrier protein phosphodiesterase [Bacteroidales bacterium]